MVHCSCCSSPRELRSLCGKGAERWRPMRARSSDAVVEEVTASSPTTSSKLFGIPCLKSDRGKAFAGFYQEAMVFKLGGAAHAKALALPGAQLFDPMHGRPMKAWVEVPAEYAARL